ncbi:MAG TPA: hypothetical protein VFJ43_07040, partial [Bacteroidia bacterium]|nr:hypothetical protein [Bacteroidia bacterium]
MEQDHNFYSLPSTHLFSADSESPLLEEKALRLNIDALNADVNFIRQIFDQRFSLPDNEFRLMDWPVLDPESGPYAKLCSNLSNAERILLLFSLLPHYAPEVLREIVSPVQQGLIITNP